MAGRIAVVDVLLPHFCCWIFIGKVRKISEIIFFFSLLRILKRCIRCHYIIDKHVRRKKTVEVSRQLR